MTARSISTNAIALVVARIGAAAASLAVAVIAARHLGEARFGTFVAALAVGFVANTLVTFGTDTVVVRSVARDPAAPDVSRSLGLQLCLAGPVVLAAGALLVFGSDAHPLALALGAAAPGVWSTTALAVLRGRERMDLAAVATTIGGAAAVIGSLVAASQSGGPTSFVAAVVCGQVTTMITATALARSVSAATWIPRFEPEMWARSRPFATMVLATAIAASAGILTLELFGSDVATGEFGAANRVSEGLRIVPAAVFGAAFPAMTRGVHRDPAYLSSVRRVQVLTAVGVLVVMVIAGPLVELLYDGFAGSADVLRVLAIGLVPLTARLRWSFELVAEGAERDVATTAVVAGAIAVLLALAAALMGGPLLVAAAGVTGLGIHAAMLWNLRRRTTEVGSTVDDGVPD